MSKSRPIQARLRTLAQRESQKITRADALLAEHAADLIEHLEAALAMARRHEAQAISNDCSSSAVVAVVRDHLRALMAHIDELT